MGENEGLGATDRAGGRLKVLVADDSEGIRARTRALLEDEGAEIVATATDGMEAVEQARALSPDLVVLDLHMPRMGGLSALSQIKRMHPAPVVAVMTNYAYSAYRSHCAELGADHFLDKSREFEHLREIVAKLAATRTTTRSVTTPEKAMRNSGDGFSLVEVLVALFLATLVFLTTAQMVGFGIEASRAAADMTRASTLAGDRLEELTQVDYQGLTPGGSIAADIVGFSDTFDVNGDGRDDYIRRWEITDLGSAKRVRVRVISTLDVLGPRKEATYVTLVAGK